MGVVGVSRESRGRGFTVETRLRFSVCYEVSRWRVDLPEVILALMVRMITEIWEKE